MRATPLVLALGLALLDGSRADACSDDPESGLIDFGVVPATGDTAPPNTKIWVATPASWDWNAPALEAADVIVKSGDVTVATTATTLVVDGEVTRAVLVVEPSERLLPGASITVTLRGDLVSTFTVGTEDDTTAPDKPRITGVDVVGGYFGGFTCPESAHVTVSVVPSDALLILTRVGATPELPAQALAMGPGDRVKAVDLPDGELALQLLAFDVAGNVAVAPVPVFTVPTEQSGCNAGGGRASLWPVLLALVVLSAARRREIRTRS